MASRLWNCLFGAALACAVLRAEELLNVTGVYREVGYSGTSPMSAGRAVSLAGLLRGKVTAPSSATAAERGAQVTQEGSDALSIHIPAQPGVEECRATWNKDDGFHASSASISATWTRKPDLRF